MSTIQIHHELSINAFTSVSTFSPYGEYVLTLCIQAISSLDKPLISGSPRQWGLNLSIPKKIILLGSLLWRFKKCFDTEWCLKPLRMLPICSFNLTERDRLVLPMYWYPHAHWSRYTTPVVVQQIKGLIGKTWPVLVDLNSFVFLFFITLREQTWHLLHL